jgi:beta-lactamase superfamily II metal-dependent hydrolase
MPYTFDHPKIDEKRTVPMTRRLLAVAVVFLLAVPAVAQNLEIHVINVGWGQATFIKGPGPTGKTVLLEAGNTGKGTAEVVPYLQSIGHGPSAGFDYTIVGHQHCDHAGGMDEVINAGYNVRIRNYDNGSSYSSSCITGWDSAASGTTAGVPVAMARGDVLDLGGGATLTCVVVRGQVIGGGNVSVSNENDLSIGLLLQYEGFDYFWASDLGGGSDDGSCTGRSTSQVNVETAVIQAISPGGAMPLIGEGGIDVLHVSHHGSESSTNNDLFDYAAPAVAVISTGAGQTSGWDLPRVDIVDNVLLANASCVTAPPTFVLQTEEGSPTGPLTSFSGYCVGDMKITTDGLSLFTIEANGGVNQGPDERNQAGLPRSFTIDESGGGTPGDTQAPVTAVTSPANGASVTGTIAVTASASDNVGVTSVEFWLDGVLAATDSSSPYSWSWNTATASPGSHSLVSKAYDAAGNIGTSAAINVTIASGVSVASYKITQAASALTYLLPAGTTIASKGYVVVARDATKAQFEAFWGVTLGANVTFINSAGAMPQINGDESYSLYNATNSRIDGATVSMASGAGESLQRKNGCGGANKATSWNRLASSAGTPGAGAPAACGKGIYISEFSDALGTGNYIYEFIELHNDK